MKNQIAPKSDPQSNHMQSNKLSIEIEGRLQLALRSISGTQYRRLLCYIHENPDAFTHRIASDCAVGYPPNRLGELNNRYLPMFGLFIRCHPPESWLKNRWGDTSHVHQWRLELLPDRVSEVAA